VGRYDEELNIVRECKSPVKGAFATFASFAEIGIIPLIAFVLSFLAGVELSIVGAIVAGAAYAVGLLLRNVI